MYDENSSSYFIFIISSLVASDDGVTVKARKSGEYVLVDGMRIIIHLV
ncbi:hypothetical protein [Sulfurimonas sp.]|nr:hypothetical protein [Sulfurimonas sp.]